MTTNDKGEAEKQNDAHGLKALREFHHRSLHLGEAPLLFVHKLKKLLEQAMPDTETADCNQITTPGL